MKDIKKLNKLLEELVSISSEIKYCFGEAQRLLDTSEETRYFLKNAINECYNIANDAYELEREIEAVFGENFLKEEVKL